MQHTFFQILTPVASPGLLPCPRNRRLIRMYVTAGCSLKNLSRSHSIRARIIYMTLHKGAHVKTRHFSYGFLEGNYPKPAPTRWCFIRLSPAAIRLSGVSSEGNLPLGSKSLPTRAWPPPVSGSQGKTYSIAFNFCPCPQQITTLTFGHL